MGLGAEWDCLFANDCDKLKIASYTSNWGNEHLDSRDVSLIKSSDFESAADLAWASFPCQDVSQAGAKKGIGDADDTAFTRSGAVWPFLRIIKELALEGRPPSLLALENVTGLLSANEGTDFRALCGALTEIGYRYGAMIVDASYFVPQSRPRVFIVAIRRDIPLPKSLFTTLPQSPWHTPTVLRASASLPSESSADWVWWSLGKPPSRKSSELIDIIDFSDHASWNSDDTTDRLLSMMSTTQQQRLAEAKAQGRPVVGSLYLRMRPAKNKAVGNLQRCEIAFGETLGCLRTPKGGASRPRIIAVDGDRVRTRLISVEEAAAVMGLGPSVDLAPSYLESFRLIGDGVVPAVVRFLADRLLEPLARHANGFHALQSLKQIPA